MSNSLLMDAISAAADIIGCCSVTDVKLGKDITFYYFFGTLDPLGLGSLFFLLLAASQGCLWPSLSIC